MRPASMAVAAMAALLMGTPAVAQQQPMPQKPPAQQKQPMQHPPAQRAGMMQGMGGMSCMDMMGGPPAAGVLHHAKALGLSAAQLQKLEALRKQDSTTVMPHMREAMAAHQAAAQTLKAERPDFAAYEARLNDAARHAIAGHVAMARSAVEARDVLTPAQRTRLQAEMKSMGGMMGQGMGMQGMGGMMGGMDCMGMMGGMMGGMQSGKAPPAKAAAPKR